MLDILVLFICLIALVNTNQSIAKKHGLPAKYINQLHILLAFHIFFSVVFTVYILNLGGDSYGYWKYLMEQVPVHYQTMGEFFGTSTTFILWMNFYPSKVLGLEYITGNILYGFLGFMGMRYLFVMVAELWPTNYSILGLPLFPTIFFFPNFHFWTGGVGKDVVCFWGIAWFMYAVQNYRKRWWQGLIALFFVYMARPHMGLSVIMAATLAILLGSEIKATYKAGLLVIAVLGSLYLSVGALEFLEIEDFSFETLDALATKKSGYLSVAGSSVDTSGYNIFMKIFTYMYRPLFIDAHNIMAFVSGFENILYLYLSFFIFRNWTPEAIRDMPVFIKAGMIAFIPITIAFASSLSNLGIIMRMKNMTMIYFVLFVFFLISYNKNLRFLKMKEKIRYYQKREEIIRKKAETATPPPLSP
ncbi:hypothetical protein [Cognataquiflexum rubidum]|uniref:hypothetical protein n=1 Tax=Cognataquiflexum rubidum TaxID=2922273 RepID=UPI001F131D51|nr:hypothetical protein [Cognataquiflexum rubidum]MCH6236519.1 hypothetical protein [Cognataquiflexum rubidum]